MRLNEAHHNRLGQGIGQRKKLSRHHRRFALFLVVSLLVPGAAGALDIGDSVPGYSEACRRITEAEIVDGAVQWLVDVGHYYDRNLGSPGLSDINPYPYPSVAEFKAQNPDCCQVLPRIPGDFPVATQKLGEENNGYRSLFAVKMVFLENTKTGFKKRHDTLLINCFGKRPTKG